MNDFDEKTQIAIIWSIEDVQGISPSLTNEEAMNVLANVKRKHDCNLGVTWDTLEFWIDELYPDVEQYPDNDSSNDDTGLSGTDDEPT